MKIILGQIGIAIVAFVAFVALFRVLLFIVW